MKNFNNRWLIIIVFFVLTCIFLYKGFLGYSIQGTDAPLGLFGQMGQQSHFIKTYFFENSWIGMKGSNVITSFYAFFISLFPIGAALWLSCFTTIFLSLVFFYLFLRRLKLDFLPAVFGAVSFAFMPPIITLIYSGHMIAMDMMVFASLLFYLLTIVFDKDEKDKIKVMIFGGLAGIVWGLLMTADVQRGLFYSIIAALFIIFKLLDNYQLKIRQIGLLFKNKNIMREIGKITIIGLFLFFSFYNGLQSWLPTLTGRNEMSKNNTSQVAQEDQNKKWEFATMWSFHPAELIDSVAFGFHGNISGDAKAPYWGAKEFAGNNEAMGFFVILFAMIGIFASYKKDKTVKFFLWVGITTLLLSFGRFFQIPYWIFYHLPLMSNFRAPSKFVSIAAFAFAVLSAYGVQYLISLAKEKNELYSKSLNRIIQPLLIILGIGLVSLFFTGVLSSDIGFGIGQKLGSSALGSAASANIVIAILRAVVFIAISLIIFYLLLKWKEKKGVMTVSILLFVFFCVIDIWYIDWFYLNKSYMKMNEFYREDGVINLLKKEYQNETFRVGTSLAIPAPDQPRMYPVTGLKGYYLTYFFPYYGIDAMDVLALSVVVPEYRNFFNRMLQTVKPVQTLNDLLDLNIRLMQLANVKYIIMDTNLGNENLILTNTVTGFDNREKYIFYLPGYLPRVAYYENYIAVSSDEEALNGISGSALDLQKYVVVKNIVNQVTDTKKPLIPLQINGHKSWDIKTEVDAPADGVVLHTTKYEPEWHAYIDGKKAPIYQANYIQMAAFVTKGRHTVEFRFEPDDKPFFISLGTILFGLVLLVAGGVRHMIINGKKEG